MKRVLGLVAAMLVASGLTFAQGVQNAPVKTPALPEGVLAAVEFGSLDLLQKHVDEFILATGALPPGQLPPVQMIFSDSLHSTDPGTMDGASPVRLLVVKAGEKKVATVLQFTVKDVGDYKASLLPDMKKVETKDGITTYTQEKEEFDRDAFMKATPEQRQAGMQGFTKTKKETVAIGEAGKAICIGRNASAVQQVLAKLSDKTLPAAVMLQGGGDVVATVELKALLNHLGDGKGGLADLRARLKESMGNLATGGEDANTAARMLEAELDALEAVVKQVERGSASATPGAQNLKISLNLVPVKGTALAAYLASVKPGIPATLKYMPEDAFTVAAFKVGDLDPMTASLVALNAKIMAAMGSDAAAIEKYNKTSAEWIRQIGDEFTFSLRSGKEVRGVFAGTGKDAEAAKALLRKVPELLAGMTDTYRKLGMEMKPETVNYNGHEIMEVKCVVAAKAPENATPDQTAKITAEQKAMKAMFGGTLIYDATVVEKGLVATMGSDARDAVQQIIDGKLKKLTDREDFKATLASIPADSCGFCHVHLTDFAEWALFLARAATDGGLPIPDIHFQRGPGVTAVFMVGPAGTSTTCNVQVPSAEIKAIVAGVKGAEGGGQ